MKHTRRIRGALPVTAAVVLALAAPASADVIHGTNGPDVLTGTANADTIHGYRGADQIHGKAGNDSLFGGRGADHVYGGRGADRVFPGYDTRKDVLYGGARGDRIFARYEDVVYAGSGNDTVVLAQHTLQGMNALVRVYCGPGHDTVHSPFGGWLIADTSGCEVWK